MLKRILLFLIAFFVFVGCEDSCDCPNDNADFFCNINGVKHYENTVSIDLSFMMLKELPDCIGNLTNLEMLNLVHNQLTALPESIRNLTKLEVMSLIGNNFSEAEKQKVESWLPNCTIYWN